MEHVSAGAAPFFVRVPDDDPLDFAAPPIRRFWEYVAGCRGAGGLPDRGRFDPMGIPRLLPYLWILEVEGDGTRLRYRLAGSAMVDALDFDPTGQTIEDIVRVKASGNSGQTLVRYWTSVREGVATWRRGPARHWRNSDWIDVESLCVPFTVGTGHVAQLIGISLRFSEQGKWIDEARPFSLNG
jgi:hypothetical protein